MPRVGIRDVAKAAGASITTVSHALSAEHADRVNAHTRRHVEEIAARLGYSSNRIASGLRSRRTYLLGMVSDQIASSPFGGDLLLGVQEDAQERGWLVTLVESRGDPSLERRQIATLLRHQVDGIVYARMFHQRLALPEEIDGVPHVLLNSQDRDGRTSSVAPDEVGAARTATTELIEAGHRRIGFLNNRQNTLASAERLEGYRAALASAGIPYRPELVTHESPGVSGGREGALRLLGLPSPPTGLFCFRDPQALGAYEAVRSLGLSIPEDLSVVSIDDFQLVSEGVRPSLTTVALPHYRMGRWAIRRLLEDIEDPDARNRAPERLLMECPLIRRGSVAPPRTLDEAT